VSNDKRAADDAEREAFEAWRLRFARDMSLDELIFARGAWNARAALSRADGGKDSSDEFRRAIEACRQVSENSGGAQYNMFGKDLAEQCAEAIAAIAKEKK
jgi:hypothetical protein